MRAEKIEVEPFNEMRVIDYQSIKQVNEHANVKITGAIPIARLDEYIKTARNIKTVKITASELNGECYTLLFGYLTIFDIKVENGVAVMTLEVKTRYMLDGKIGPYKNISGYFNYLSYSFRDLQ